MPDELSPLGREMVAGLREFRDALRDGEPIEERFRVDVLISANLRQEWIGNDPGDDCFDRDEAAMDGLCRFIGGTATAEEATRTRGHLLRCPRCRFTFAAIRQAGEGS